MPRTAHMVKVGKRTIYDAQSAWVEPKGYFEVRYASITGDGILRACFVRLKARCMKAMNI